VQRDSGAPLIRDLRVLVAVMPRSCAGHLRFWRIPHDVAQDITQSITQDIEIGGNAPALPPTDYSP
jgi:hypothetical protein